MSALEAGRLRVVPATPELIEAERTGAGALAEAIGATLPRDWPPEHHDPEAVRYSREALSAPGATGWWLHYFTVIEGAGPALVGVGGYKGPPVDGLVEIGYSVVPSAQRRGYGTAAVGGLVASARERGATTVRAETLPDLAASIRVLEKLGFAPAEPSRPGVIAFEVRDRR